MTNSIFQPSRLRVVRQLRLIDQFSRRTGKHFCSTDFITGRQPCRVPDTEARNEAHDCGSVSSREAQFSLRHSSQRLSSRHHLISRLVTVVAGAHRMLYHADLFARGRDGRPLGRLEAIKVRSLLLSYRILHRQNIIGSFSSVARWIESGRQNDRLLRDDLRFVTKLTLSLRIQLILIKLGAHTILCQL